MIYGYVRVSTKGQALNGNSIEAQTEELKKHGCTKIYSDKCSGAKMSRPEFDKLLEVLEEGDTLMSCKLDRIARNSTDGYEVIKGLLARGVSVHVLNMGVIDDSITGRLILQIMLAFAEFERSMIRERMLEGKAVAKQKEGYSEGRPPKYTKAQLELAMSLLENCSYSEVERMTGISKSTLVREKRKKKDA